MKDPHTPTAMKKRQPLSPQVFIPTTTRETSPGSTSPIAGTAMEEPGPRRVSIRGSFMVQQSNQQSGSAPITTTTTLPSSATNSGSFSSSSPLGSAGNSRSGSISGPPTASPTATSASMPNLAADDVDSAAISALVNKLYYANAGASSSSPTTTATATPNVAVDDVDSAAISALVNKLYYGNSTSTATTPRTTAPPRQSSDASTTALNIDADSLEPVLESLLLSAFHDMTKQVKSELEAVFDSHFRELGAKTEKMEKEVRELRKLLGDDTAASPAPIPSV